MSTKRAVRPESAKVVPMTMRTANVSELLQQYGCGPIPFVGTENALYERHLIFDRAIDPKVASARERFEAFSRSVRDILFADYSFLNRDLARHYGIDLPAVPTNGVARIDGVNQFHRGGLLRLGAVLTATSAPLRTSAVKRGDWVLRRVLGKPIPPPPGDAGSIPVRRAIMKADKNRQCSQIPMVC